MTQILGYARVSTADQDLDLQREKLLDAGCNHVYEEKISGAESDRYQLRQMLKRLERGDIILVTRLDRLARSMPDLFEILGKVTKVGAHFRSLGDPGIDTTTAHGRLLIGILGSLAEFERTLILERTNEGRVRAQRNGVKFGRKRKLSEFQTEEMIARIDAGESYATVAATYGVYFKTVGRLYREAMKARTQNTCTPACGPTPA